MKVRRKIVALGTALAMAFVMIASLVMVTDVKAENITPAYGEQVYIMPNGNIEVDPAKATGAVVRVSAGTVDSITGDEASKTLTFKNLSSSGTFDIDESGWTFVFEGTNVINKNKTEYGVFGGQLNLEQGTCTIKMANDAKLTAVGGVNAPSVDAIKLADGTTVNKNPFVTTDYENPITDVVFSGSASGGGESGGDDTSSVPVKDGYANQTVAPGSSVTIGFEKDFSDFNNGTEQGKVYIDGNEVPGQYVNATPGSTIIQIAEEYMKQLSEGAHKMVVKFLDGTEGEASFTVSSSAAASTAANGTSGTASSTAATTTKVTSPKTADVLPIAGIALVFVGATAIGVIAFRRKNS